MKKLLFILSLASCAPAPVTNFSGPAPTPTPVPAPRVSTAPATATECASGGTELLVNGVEQTVVCNGSNGSNGSNGTNGLNGTQINMIQFCPGITPTYPSSFPEVALCINGNLYGVYSANGGFLAYLPPGQYSSDGINASCTFTIQANCVVVP